MHGYVWCLEKAMVNNVCSGEVFQASISIGCIFDDIYLSQMYLCDCGQKSFRNLCFFFKVNKSYTQNDNQKVAELMRCWLCSVSMEYCVEQIKNKK